MLRSPGAPSTRLLIAVSISELVLYADHTFVVVEEESSIKSAAVPAASYHVSTVLRSIPN